VKGEAEHQDSFSKGKRRVEGPDRISELQGTGEKAVEVGGGDLTQRKGRGECEAKRNSSSAHTLRRYPTGQQEKGKGVRQKERATSVSNRGKNELADKFLLAAIPHP